MDTFLLRIRPSVADKWKCVTNVDTMLLLCCREIIQSSKKVLASLQKGHPTFMPTLAIVQASDEDLVQEINQNFAKEIVGEILRLNEDPTVHGVALHLSENAYSNKILNAVKPEKDVDGVSDVNLGRLVRGDTYNCSVSPTASAVMELLGKIVETIDGKKVLLVGTCGPLEASLQCLLQRKGAMTMSCQWKTQQLQSKLHQADVVVVGSTKPKEIPVSWIRPGTTIVSCYPDFLSGEHGYGQDLKYSNQSAVEAVGPLAIAVRMQVREHGYGQDLKYSNQSAVEAVGPLAIAVRMQNMVKTSERWIRSQQYREWNLHCLKLQPLSPVPSDIEISRGQSPKAVDVLAKEIGLLADEIEIYGQTKAKVRLSLLERLKDQPDGKYVLVAGCLGEAHQAERCKICKAFKPHTKKEKDFHLKQLLMEAALQPAAPDHPDPTPLSLAPSDFSTDQCLEEVLEPPSKPDTFEAAKDLIELSAPNPFPCKEKPLAPPRRVLSRGKRAVVRRSVTDLAPLTAPFSFELSTASLPSTDNPT
ncbi:Monofunctional C1-tetrahydrofolate synthase [Chelonia mydas]|uniref:Monofunctional C1-tetrahydrofolate synthase n=1 Tax=Chelonia mydas TaxID=8469 RepID=M7BBB9_CHEMY|nr:Monofunctional C1-tetrahydrofolate synthase [Chelonia mydas]